jgi:hypothetical protein
MKKIMCRACRIESDVCASSASFAISGGCRNPLRLWTFSGGSEVNIDCFDRGYRPLGRNGTSKLVFTLNTQLAHEIPQGRLRVLQQQRGASLKI